MSCAAGPTLLPNIRYNFFILPPPLHLVKKTSKKFHEKPPVIFILNFLEPVKKIFLTSALVRKNLVDWLRLTTILYFLFKLKENFIKEIPLCGENLPHCAYMFLAMLSRTNVPPILHSSCRLSTRSIFALFGSSWTLDLLFSCYLLTQGTDQFEKVLQHIEVQSFLQSQFEFLSTSVFTNNFSSNENLNIFVLKSHVDEKKCATYEKRF